MSGLEKKKTGFSSDWLLRGILTKIGDTFDRLTGRRYQASSSLATSELIEKLKKLLDLEVKNGRFVPHNIKLKMQWDKFSADSDDAIKRLEEELKIAVVDHINDNLYHTYAPIRLQVKPDYFTEGVKLLVSFDKFVEEEPEVAISVTVPQISVGDYIPESEAPEVVPADDSDEFAATFTAAGKARRIEFRAGPQRRVSVGRGAENELRIDDGSVSKHHASLVLAAGRSLAVADTGSTNGTFINGQRIAYGKAIPFEDSDAVRFGTVEIRFERLTPPVEIAIEAPAEGDPDAPTVEMSATEVPQVTAGVTAPTAIPRPQFEIVRKIEPEGQSSDEPVPQTQDRVVLDFGNSEGDGK